MQSGPDDHRVKLRQKSALTVRRLNRLRRHMGQVQRQEVTQSSLIRQLGRVVDPITGGSDCNTGELFRVVRPGQAGVVPISQRTIRQKNSRFGLAQR